MEKIQKVKAQPVDSPLTEPGNIIHSQKSEALAPIPEQVQHSTRPYSGFLFGLILIAIIIFLCVGTFAREPWKADEPYSFGMVLNFLQGHFGHIVPYVGADPFVEKPPLMYWSGALFAYLNQAWLTLFQGAQFAVMGWMGVTLASLWWASQSIDREISGVNVCVLLLSSLGIIIPIHMLTADVSQLAGAAMIVAGLALAEKPSNKALTTGAVIGTGAGIAFLSKGVLLPGVLGITYLFALCFSQFRTKQFVRIGGWSLLALLPWLLIWPALFWQHSPSLFIEWFWDNNFGRFLGFANLGGHKASYSRYITEVLSLVLLTFPCGWVAVSGLYHRVRHPLTSIRILLWIYVFVLTGALFASSSFRTIYLLPMFPALALLGVGVSLPEAIDKWLIRLSWGVFGTVGVALWLYWLMSVTANQQCLPLWLGRWLWLDYVLPLHIPFFALASVISIIWLVSCVYHKKLGGIIIWFTGVMFVWGLLNTLLLPWIDEARSYKKVFGELRQILPQSSTCLMTYHVGESERAMLDYYVGIKPQQISQLHSQRHCPLLLIQARNEKDLVALNSHGREIWQGKRRGNHKEQFRLFIRE